jgi:hypothetical protein
MKKHKCGKWNHDFSYKGKLSCHDVKCRYCGIGMVEWNKKIVEEWDKKIDDAGRSMKSKPIKYCRGPAPNAYG